MSAEKTLEIIQAQPEGRILLQDLVEKVQEATAEERHGSGLKPVHVRQVQRWLDQLERDGSVSGHYLRSRGRPLEVLSREYVCETCQGEGSVLCETCHGNGMVFR